MRCRGLHRVAKPAYLSRFPFCALLGVAPYCVRGGVRVVSIIAFPSALLKRGSEESKIRTSPFLSSMKRAKYRGDGEGSAQPHSHSYSFAPRFSERSLRDRWFSCLLQVKVTVLAVYRARGREHVRVGRMLLCGRVASVRFHPNLQNIPRSGPLRSYIRAPEGRLFVIADFSQIELRIAAKISGDK